MFVRLLRILPLPLLFMLLAACSKAEQQKPVAASPAAGPAVKEPAPDGEVLFKQYCSSCHPDGGNVSDPDRTLRGSVLKKNHITSPDDVVSIMRAPLSRMIRFDESSLSDRDARAIAEYALKTFK